MAGCVAGVTTGAFSGSEAGALMVKESRRPRALENIGCEACLLLPIGPRKLRRRVSELRRTRTKLVNPSSHARDRGGDQDNDYEGGHDFCWNRFCPKAAKQRSRARC